MATAASPALQLTCNDLLQLQALTTGLSMNQVRRLQYFAADSSWSDQPFLERHWQAVGAC